MPPTVRLTGESFGRENTGVIYGWIAASHQVGASLAAFGAGAVRSSLGTYQFSFWAAGLLCVIAGLWLIATHRSTFTLQTGAHVPPAAAGSAALS